MYSRYPSRVLISGGREIGGVTSFAEALRAGFSSLGIAAEVIAPAGILRRRRDLRDPEVLKILSTTAVFAAPLARRAICVAHGFPRADMQGWIKTAGILVSYRLANWNCRLAAVSHYSAAHLRALFKIRVDAVIHNPLNELFLEENGSEPHERDTITFAGRLHLSKGLDAIVPAIRIVLGEHPHLRGAIIGDGVLRPALEVAAGGDPRIEFTGPLSQDGVRRWLRRTRVFVSGCETEALGIGYLEALSQGCAVVMPACGGGLEIAPELIGRTIHLYSGAGCETVTRALRTALRSRARAGLALGVFAARHRAGLSLCRPRLAQGTCPARGGRSMNDALAGGLWPADATGMLALARSLTLPSVRLTLARALVAFCFVWPYFNYTLVDPTSHVEINFLPVFLAAILLPEVTLREMRSLLLALPVFLVALIWGNPTAPLRLAIGIVPLHFVLNLTRHLRERNRDLLPPNLAYRTLQVFVCFCIAQAVDTQLFPILPGWLTNTLTNILPRYSGMPYDEFGIHGVQGWASEPSGAAVMGAAFALVAILQRPSRRWRVLALFLTLTAVNKSVYVLMLLVLLSIGCLATTARRRYALMASVPVGAAVLFLIVRSARLVDLRSDLLINGTSSSTNNELARITQILAPLGQFPRIYNPPMLFGGIVLEPMGLLPLVAGYGSVLGIVWLIFLLRRNFPLRQIPLRPLALVAGAILLVLTAPDFIPAVVAFAFFMVPVKREGPPSRSPCEGTS